MLQAASKYKDSYATGYVHQLAWQKIGNSKRLAYARIAGKATFVKAIAGAILREQMLRVQIDEKTVEYLYGAPAGRCLYHKVGKAGLGTYYTENLFNHNEAISHIIAQTEEEAAQILKDISRMKPIVLHEAWDIYTLLKKLDLITPMEAYNCVAYEVFWNTEKINAYVGQLVRAKHLTLAGGQMEGPLPEYQETPIEEPQTLVTARESDVIEEGPWAGFEVISTYSRAQAIEDGVLVDVTELSKEAGFKFPIAMTATVWYEYVTPPCDLAGYGQSEEGRLWDILSVLRYTLKTGGNTDLLFFDVAFLMEPDKHETVRLKAHCGPGDHGEPVITIMLVGED